MNDTENNEGESVDNFSKRFSILDSVVFNDLMLFCIRDISKIFDAHLKKGQDKKEEDDGETIGKT